MAAPNHVDHQAAAAAGASSSASPKAAAHDPSVSPADRDPTQHLVEMLACTALGTPKDTTNQVDQPQAAAAAAEVGASDSAATAAGHCPGVVVAPDDDDLITVTLTKAFATTTLETAAAVANKAAPSVSEPPPIRATDKSTPAAKPACDRAERKARRRTRLRLIRVPSDYLRAGQESSDRRRRRDLVRRCVGRLFSVHEDRASERGISTMMAHLTTTTPDSASDATVVSAAAPSAEHAALADLLEKMALSKKNH